MEHEHGNGRLAALEERFAGYEVHDNAGEKIGGIDLILADDDGRPEYVGLKIGSLGAGSPLIPMEAIWVDEGRRVIEVPLRKSKVEDGPSYHDDQEVTPNFELRVRRYYGLPSVQDPKARGTTMGEREAVDDRHHEHTAGVLGEEGAVWNESGRGDALRDTLGDTDELQVQRSEEELRVDTRKREAGRMNVRKKVRTEREQVRVPKRREEVTVDRVPGEDREVSEAEIGDEEEIVVQVFEEEVVVSKRVVLKEEIRIRKKVVVEEEVIEVDLRKEEVDIEDTTGHNAGRNVGHASKAAD